MNIYRLLCRLGIHQYQVIRISIDGHPYWKFDREECQICGKTRQFGYY